MEEFGLEELSPYLTECHVKLDLSFLKNLLENVSKCRLPHRNLEFARHIECPINKNKKSAMTIYGWLSGQRTIPLHKLIKIIIDNSVN